MRRTVGASIVRTRHHCVVNDSARTGGTDAGRSHGSAGLEGRIRRLAAGGRVGPHDPARRAGRSARLRVPVGVRSLPHGARAERRDDVRVVRRPRRAGSQHRARPARPHGRVHGIPQSGADGQAIVDHRRHQRRSLRAGHRRRLEGRRVARVRLRLPAAGRTARRLRRPPRGHHRDVRAGTRHARGSLRPRPRGDQRAARHPGAAHPDHRRRQRAAGHGRVCHPLRGRAQLRLPRAR